MDNSCDEPNNSREDDSISFVKKIDALESIIV